jgi:NADH-quinone oxidoreductase subunit J
MIGFIVLAVVMLAGAVGVVTLRQPVHAALSLVVTLLALAVTYVTLQAHFLAVIQVIVYAGAIMVLFLFVIMLLNVEGQAPPPHLRWLPPLAFATALLVAAGIAVTAFVDRAPLPAAARVSALQGGSAEQVGTLLFSHYVLAFQLVGVLLLAGIVGAVSLAQRGSRGDASGARSEGASDTRELSHG